MNEIKSKSEALKIISEIAKKWWGDCVSVNIFVNCCGIDVTTIEKPFTVGCSMRTINGTWLPLKENEYV